jgi:hypothetical protein
MPLTVKQIKEREPLADVTELQDGVRYLVKVHSEITLQSLDYLKELLASQGLHNVLVCGPDIEFLEIVD